MTVMHSMAVSYELYCILFTQRFATECADQLLHGHLYDILSFVLKQGGWIGEELNQLVFFLTLRWYTILKRRPALYNNNFPYFCIMMPFPTDVCTCDSQSKLNGTFARRMEGSFSRSRKKMRLRRFELSK